MTTIYKLISSRVCEIVTIKRTSRNFFLALTSLFDLILENMVTNIIYEILCYCSTKTDSYWRDYYEKIQFFQKLNCLSEWKSDWVSIQKWEVIEDFEE